MRQPYASLLIGCILLHGGLLRAQCTNTTQYPGTSITPDASGLLTTISTCSFQSEYSRITGIAAGSAYQFTIADNSYITVRQGTFNGAVLAHGLSPITVVPTNTGDLFAHWTVNAACANATACLTTTVQRLLECTPPTVEAAVENDCANEQFSVVITVSDTGDASALSFVYTVNGGGLTVQSGIGLGTYTIGPFPFGALVDLTVAHADDALCNVVLNDLTNTEPCTTQSCGPDTYTFCYGNNENYTVTYEGASTWPLQLVFNSGNVSPSGNDAMVIHDGLDDTAPILFSGVGNAGNLTGVTVVSTNPDHALTLRFTSNSSFSCADGGVSPPWNYTVSCLDCAPPVAAAGQVTADCDAGTFTVEVFVSDTGSSSDLAIVNDAGVPPTAVNGTGSFVAGPFPVGSSVALSVVNQQSAACTVALGTFASVGCPIPVTCGQPAVQGAYCYTDDDARGWLYQGDGVEPLVIVFTQGQIESVTWDRLAIYDGPDNTAPVLWEHNTQATINLTGLQVAATGPVIYMEMSSDNSISCASGSLASWIWNVTCLDCTNPQANFTVVPDCAHNRYTVQVEVTDLGTADDLVLSNNVNGDVLDGVGLGITELGPFPIQTGVIISLTNSANELCRINSDVLSYPADSCILFACEPTPQSLCYGNSDTLWFVYQSPIDVPITISFAEGGMLGGDQIMLYNGPDDQSQLVYAGNAGGDVGGITLTSNNADNALTLVVVSDSAGSCADGTVTPAMNWTVGCGLVGMEEGEATSAKAYPNPASNVVLLTWPGMAGGAAQVDVLDAIGRIVLRERIGGGGVNGGPLAVEALPTGRYTLIITAAQGRWVLPLLIGR